MEKLFDSLEKRPLREEVYEALKKAIVCGRIESGQVLREDGLAEQLGTSRTPIREAIFRIEQEGLIKKLPRGGFCVNDLCVEEIEEIFDLMCLLEMYAAEKSIHLYTAEDILAMEENLRLFERAVRENRIDEIVSLNNEFHTLLYHPVQLKWFPYFIKYLDNHITRYRARILRVQGREESSLQDHKRIVAAVKARDRKRIRLAVQRHIQTGKEALVRILRQDNKAQLVREVGT